MMKHPLRLLDDELDRLLDVRRDLESQLVQVNTRIKEYEIYTRFLAGRNIHGDGEDD